MSRNVRRRDRRHRQPRRPKGPKPGQWTSVLVMLGALVLLLMFRDDFALRLSGLLGAASTSNTDLQLPPSQTTTKDDATGASAPENATNTHQKPNKDPKKDKEREHTP